MPKTQIWTIRLDQLCCKASFQHVQAGIEKSENVADISKKYRISDGAETIIVTDYRSTEKWSKNRQNRRNIGEAPIYRKISRYFPTSPARAVVCFSLAQKSWI